MTTKVREHFYKFKMNKKLNYTKIFADTLCNFKLDFMRTNLFLGLILSALSSNGLTAQAGKDGALTISTVNTVLNRYTQPTANIAVGATTITVTAIADLSRDNITYLPSGFVTNTTGFANNTLSAGDLLMIFQAQGASINTTNTINYGAVNALNGAGSYELARVQSVSGNVITLACATKSAYSVTGHVQVIRVPQYTTLTVNAGSSITAIPWGAPSFGGADPSAVERRRGGFNAVLANNIVNNGNINANIAGFRGGTIENLTSGPTANTFYTDYVTTNEAFSAEKGESIAGYRTDYDALGGRYGRGAAANGGGGGNAHNAGGGGGANGGNINNWFKGAGRMSLSGTCTPTAWRLDPDYIANGNALTTSSGGGRGGYTYGGTNLDACNVGPSYPAGAISAGVPAADVSNTGWTGDRRSAVGGLGGRPINSTTFQRRIIFGGGGGAGDGNNNANSDGADGGGIVFLVVNSAITGIGAIQANGENAAPTSGGHNDAPGGGGGGGTVLIQAANVGIGQTISANGGSGGNQLITSDESEGPGGGGGGGVIAVNSTTDSSTKAVTGGAFGTTSSSAVTEFPANGATNGSTGSTYAITESISICGACYKPLFTTGTVLETKIGISSLSRAGASNGNWPMVRTGAHIALESKNKGFVPTRVADPVAAIANPLDGMMVYDTTLDCLRIYVVDSLSPTNTGWKCFSSQSCPD